MWIAHDLVRPLAEPRVDHDGVPHLEWKICHAHPRSVGVVLKFYAGILYGISGFPLYDPRMFPYSTADLSE
jgi:hypothetical protein